jgi:hypothetical protein
VVWTWRVRCVWSEFAEEDKEGWRGCRGWSINFVRRGGEGEIVAKNGEKGRGEHSVREEEEEVQRM